MGDDISRQQGNWSQLRTLVLRLLQAHEDTLDEHDKKIGLSATVDAELKKDLDRCLEEIFGDASTDSLRTAIRLVQAEQAGMRKDVEGAHAKANAAHAKANELAKNLAAHESKCLPAVDHVAKKEGPSTKVVAGLVGIITVLANAVIELLKHLFSGG